MHLHGVNDISHSDLLLLLNLVLNLTKTGCLGHNLTKQITNFLLFMLNTFNYYCYEI